MKKFYDLKIGDILIRDTSDNVVMLYVVDDFDKINNFVELTYIKVYGNITEIGDGIMFDIQTWVKNGFDDRFSDMPSDIGNNLQHALISGIMGEITWT